MMQNLNVRNVKININLKTRRGKVFRNAAEDSAISSVAAGDIILELVIYF